MNDTITAHDMTISADNIKLAAQTIASHMPRGESRQVRRAVVGVLSDWVDDPTADMSVAEKRAFIERCKAELRRRGEPVD